MKLTNILRTLNSLLILGLTTSIISCTVVDTPVIKNVERTNMSSHSTHVKITGLVQGVGYRAWTQKEAKRLNIAGWVMNKEDGSVEAVFQGDPNVISKMVEKLKEGPQYSKVDNVEIISEDMQPLCCEFIIKS